MVDWEMARVGDPAWDLAGLMLRPLLDAAPGRQGWTDASVEAASAMVSAHCAVSGLNLRQLPSASSSTAVRGW